MAKLVKRNKGVAPSLEQASSNLGDVNEAMKRMNFLLPESFVKEYKQFALDQGISLTELFKRSFTHYQQSNHH